MSLSKPSHSKTLFQENWLKHAEFKDWLVRGVNAQTFGCKVCRKHDLSITIMGQAALRSHAKGAKHMEKAKSIQKNQKLFLTKRKATIVIDDEAPTPPKVQVLTKESSAFNATIIWAFQVVDSGSSFNSFDKSNELFTRMFPDSEIAKQFTMKKDKLQYVVNFGLSEFIKQELVDLVKKSPWFVISFDESLNQKLQQTQMDLVVRFWDDTSSLVRTRYFNTSYLGHARATDLLTNFNQNINQLEANSMLQVAMDGPSVNHSFLKMVKKDREEKAENGLIDIGSCFIHTMHNAFKCGAEANDWKMKEIMKAAYKIFHDSPARREDFMSITDSNTFPLDFIATRWIEDAKVADRLILVWPNIVKYINHLETTIYKKAPSKRPKTKSYERILAATRDRLMIPKLENFSFVASKFEDFLTFFQSDSPLLAFAHDRILSVVVSILPLVFKSDLVDACKSLYKFADANLADASSMLKSSDVNVGFAAKLSLAKLKREGTISASQEHDFRKQSAVFAKTTLLKMQKGMALKSVVLTSSSCFDPNLILKSPKACSRRFDNLVKHVIGLGIMTSKEGDQAKDQYDKMKKQSRKLAMFNNEKDRLDDFFFNKLTVEKEFPKVAMVMKMVFILSHGQAAVERGFSHNNTVLQNNISGMTVSGKRFVKDYLVSNEIKPHEVKITDTMARCMARSLM